MSIAIKHSAQRPAALGGGLVRARIAPLAD